MTIEALEAVKKVKKKYEKLLLDFDCVLAVGISEDGLVVTIYDDNPKIPKFLDGIPVILKKSVKIKLQ